MILAHLRLRRRVGLLAAGLLDGRQEAAVREHLGRCPRCRRDDQELRSLIALLETDPSRSAEPAVPLPGMVERVERELARPARTAERRPRAWLAALPVAAALLAALAVVPQVVTRLRSADRPGAADIPAAPAPVLSEDALVRLERNLAREHAVRYLDEAGDVLVAVAAAGLDDTRRREPLDVGEAPQRSRALLARRRLVVDPAGEAVASARGVLDDVDLALREVAELPPVVERHEVERLREQVERRQLLMRIRLMTRELEG